MAETIFDHYGQGLSLRERQNLQMLASQRDDDGEAPHFAVDAAQALAMDDAARAANDPRHKYLRIEQEAHANAAALAANPSFARPMEQRDLALYHGSNREPGVATLDFRQTDANTFPALNKIPAIWGGRNFDQAGGYTKVIQPWTMDDDEFYDANEEERQRQVYYLDLQGVKVLPIDPGHYFDLDESNANLDAVISHLNPDVVEVLTDGNPTAYIIREPAKGKVAVTRVLGGYTDSGLNPKRPTDIVGGDVSLMADSSIPAAEPSEAFCRLMFAALQEKRENLHPDAYADLTALDSELRYWQERCDKAAAKRLGIDTAAWDKGQSKPLSIFRISKDGAGISERIFLQGGEPNKPAYGGHRGPLTYSQALALDDYARRVRDPRHAEMRKEEEIAEQVREHTGPARQYLTPPQIQDLVIYHGSLRPEGVAALDFRATERNRFPILRTYPAVWGAQDYELAGGYSAHSLMGDYVPDTDDYRQDQVYYLDVPQAKVIGVNLQGELEYDRNLADTLIHTAVERHDPDVLALTEYDGEIVYVILGKAKDKVGVVRVAGTTHGATGAAASQMTDVPLQPDSPLAAADPSETFCHAMRQYWSRALKGDDPNAGEYTRQRAAGELAYWEKRCEDAAVKRQASSPANMPALIPAAPPPVVVAAPPPVVVAAPPPVQPRLGQGSLFPMDTLPPPASGNPSRPAGAAVKTRAAKARPRSSVPKIAKRKR